MTDEDSGDNVISLEKIKNESGFSSQNGFKAFNDVIDDDDDDNSNLSSKFVPQSTTPVVDLQNPFQPCSTPIHLQRRFMVIYYNFILHCTNICLCIFLLYRFSMMLVMLDK